MLTEEVLRPTVEEIIRLRSTRLKPNMRKAYEVESELCRQLTVDIKYKKYNYKTAQKFAEMILEGAKKQDA